MTANIASIFSELPARSIEKLVAINDLISFSLDGGEIPPETLRSLEVMCAAMDDWLGDAVAETLISESEKQHLLGDYIRYGKLARERRAGPYVELRMPAIARRASRTNS